MLTLAPAVTAKLLQLYPWIGLDLAPTPKTRRPQIPPPSLVDVSSCEHRIDWSQPARTRLARGSVARASQAHIWFPRLPPFSPISQASPSLHPSLFSSTTPCIMGSYARDYSPSDDTEKYTGKGGIELIETSAAPLPAGVADIDAHLSPEERARIDRALVRKLDFKLIPWLTLLYLCAFLDRTNIGNAKVDGLQKDLKMTQGQYNASLSIFFVSYAIFEPITNVLLKRFRPRVFLTVTVILWGIVMTCMGLVKSFSGLCAARWFLGVAEAGLFPGVNYYLSCWYKRSEFGIRAAIFFSAAALAGSFGGLLAAGINKMKGVGGLDGWSWIFVSLCFSAPSVSLLITIDEDP